MNSTVTLANWRLSPWNRWAFQNVSELLPVARIAAGSGNESHFSPAPSDLTDVQFKDANGTAWTIGRMLPHTETDGFLVLQDGKIAFEWYGNGLTATTPHIVFSVSKSISAILAGILVDGGKLDPDAPVTRYVPEAAGSAYGDCTVRHVLDMTVDVAFDEKYLDTTGAFARYRMAMGWNPVSDPSHATDLYSFLVTLQRDSRPHGECFHYVSPNSDMLGWIIERAGDAPYARQLSELIWKPLGAETDAYVTVDRLGAPRAAGGVCVSLHDLARFGEMLRNQGRVGERQIVPESWIDDILRNGDAAAWTIGDLAYLLPRGRYRSKWYMTGNEHGAYCAIGIHGQWLYIDPAARMVIAKLSSQTLPGDDAVDLLLLQAFEAIGNALAR